MSTWLKPFALRTACSPERRRRRVHEAVMELPERQREVVLLRVFEELSTRETAERMDCAEGTVKATLSHAVANLKRLMSRSDQ